jgi:hypothetical protein
MTNVENFNGSSWSRHLDTYRKAQERVTPILAKQADNAPKKK